MIDEDKTFELFGYTSDMLKPNSHKKVWRICNMCNHGRLVEYSQYTDLCHVCCHQTEEYKLRQSENSKGRQHTKESKLKISKGRRGLLIGDKNPMYGKRHTEETKRKISNSLKGDKNPNWKGGNKISQAKSDSKRRELFGFIPHNIPHENFHGHHIDFNHVIFIPKKLHMSISHSVINNKNMNLINDAVCDWYLKFQINI